MWWRSLLNFLTIHALHYCNYEGNESNEGSNSKTIKTMDESNQGPINITSFHCKHPYPYISIKIGLVIDEGFYALFGHNYEYLMNYIESVIFQNTNSIYENQFGIHLDLGDIYIGNESFPNYSNLPSTNYWWLDGPKTITGCTLSYDQITNIRQWQWDKWNKETQENKETHGTWIYLAGCYPGFGIAPVGSICKIDWLNGGVVNYDKEQTWMSFAHELGHIFGAGHFFDNGNGGIMDYGEQLYNTISQFRDGNAICSIIEELNKFNTNHQKFKTNCWRNNKKTIDEYQWIQTGIYTECLPKQSIYRYKIESIKCQKINKNQIQIVDDKYCKSILKPSPKFYLCPLLNSLTKPSSITTEHKAFFTDDHNIVYMFKNDKVYTCCGIVKNITDMFKIILTNIEAAFRVISTNTLYLIKNKQYIRIDLSSKNEKKISPWIKIKPKNNDCEFGYIPNDFWQCMTKYPISGAFAVENDFITLACQTMFYTFNLHINGAFDNVYRPFIPLKEMNGLSSFMEKNKRIVRLYMNNSFKDYVYGTKQIFGVL